MATAHIKTGNMINLDNFWLASPETLMAFNTIDLKTLEANQVEPSSLEEGAQASNIRDASPPHIVMCQFDSYNAVAVLGLSFP